MGDLLERRGRQMIDSVNSYRLALTIVFNVQPTELASKSLSGQSKSR